MLYFKSVEYQRKKGVNSFFYNGSNNNQEIETSRASINGMK